MSAQPLKIERNIMMADTDQVYHKQEIAKRLTGVEIRGALGELYTVEQGRDHGRTAYTVMLNGRPYERFTAEEFFWVVEGGRMISKGTLSINW